MIRGVVNARREAIVRLRVRGPAGTEIDVDAVIDSGDCGTEPTTVIDLSQQEPVIVRRGAGDTSGFE